MILKEKVILRKKAFSVLTWSAETKAARTNMMLRWEQSQVHALLCVVPHLQPILLTRASDLQEDARRAPEGQGENSSRKEVPKRITFFYSGPRCPQRAHPRTAVPGSRSGIRAQRSSAHEPGALQLICTFPSPQRDHLPDTEVNTVHTQCS